MSSPAQWLDVRLRCSKGVHAQGNAKGAVILNAHAGVCWELNPSGAKIWDCLASGMTARETGTHLCQVLAAEASRIADDTAELGAQLVRANLMVVVDDAS